MKKTAMKMKKMKLVFPVLMFTALLSGCAATHSRPSCAQSGTFERQQMLSKKLQLMQAKVARIETQLNKEKGQLSSTGRSALVQKLNALQVQVVKVGQTVRIILPSHDLFSPNSANVKTSYANQVMPMIAKLMRHYDKSNIAVVAYTDASRNVMRAKALTDRQAQAVSSELWAQGVNARLLYSKGQGEKDPIATNKTPQGRFANRRVEIRFRFYVPEVM